MVSKIRLEPPRTSEEHDRPKDAREILDADFDRQAKKVAERRGELLRRLAQ